MTVNLVKQNYRHNKSLFENIRCQLATLLGKNVVINHIGSTAIPNMVGKNIVDILIGVNSEVQLVDVSATLEKKWLLRGED